VELVIFRFGQFLGGIVDMGGANGNGGVLCSFFGSIAPQLAVAVRFLVCFVTLLADNLAVDLGTLVLLLETPY
jgi:hypothetical protein